MVLAYTELIDSFTTTPASTWNNYDISTLKGVPKGAIVEIALCNAQTGTEQTMGVRTDGSALNRSILIHEAEGGGEVVYTMPVKVHATTGLIECYTTATGNYFRILGYFTGCDFTEAYSSFDSTAALSWLDLDLGTANNLVHSVLTTHNIQDTTYGYGIRMKGSTLTRYISHHEPEAGGSSGFMWYVKSNSSDVIQYFSSNTAVDIIDLGYFDSTVDFVEAWSQKDVAASITWTDFDLTAEMDVDGRIANFYIGNKNLDNEYNVGVRTDGSGLNRYILIHESEGVGLNENNGYTVSVATGVANGVVELYTGLNTAGYFWFAGYFKPVGAGPTPGWNKLQYLTEPPTAGAFNKIAYETEPPVSAAWNKIKYTP